MMDQLLFLNLSDGVVVLLVLALVLYPLTVIYCLVDIIRSRVKWSATKLLWILVIVFAPFVGSIAYLMIGRDRELVA
ncbi:PLD nuclease N-terminal domain-containing protein [Mucilaginibacter daejeonensis]|uniref:PLD nuclease N-terminal domain-containing protein n=1 Tax=Mucilaginibacter daejeonensis TaxID=398049 RepID=UPI001D170CC7|nr:PLD nuclease N-terminal domain-containing protein [Mucilaginibacter daejeonensis]UEG52361.1 PLD nuclease N-terminal domain-containing protein [Mucilaginibacter daejeonensis]